MKKAMSIKNRLISAVLVLVMTFTSLIGTTFAWFTDTVSSVGNTIESGTLKVDLLHKDGDDWISLKENEDHLVFDYKKWEPGFTLVETLKVQNLGSLALKYKLSIEVEAGTAKLGKNGENLADVIDVWVYYGETTATGYGDITAANSGWVKKGTLTEVFGKPGEFMNGNLLPTGNVSNDANVGVGNQIVNVALHMQESAGNEYQKLSVGNIYVNLVATQLTSESDSFGSDYDNGAEFPTFSGSYIASAPVELDNENKVVNDVMLLSDDGTIGAIVPAGTLLKPGTTKVTLNVTTLDKSESNVVASENQNLNAIDVHVEEVAEGNTTPIIVTIEQLLAPGLNIGNYDLYHVEDGATVVMSHVADAADLDVHNEFTYDPATGDVKVAMASFSEVVTVSEKVNAWKGERDYSWYDAEATELTIANADQLAAFSAIVGGMAKKDAEGNIYTSTGVDENATVIQDGFKGKTVKLIADINLGDAEDSNISAIIFYPIGYWNNEEMYERKPAGERVEAVDSGLYTFYGTFDGNGHTISNFYQNTWEMKGDHNWYSAVTEQYYRDGMGLFGRVYGATIKNLTVTNFSSDGEIATTGVIAAYADCGSTFENIAIFNCNPRVYNIGNGGIVGCAGWYNKTESTAENPVAPITFKNITVDNSNKISALWGSYDVPCGGILGQYYPTSGQSSYNYPANTGLYFENCHVSAQLDVYNDVCANYQYYAYRYAGMLIGSVRENTTTADGKTIPDMTGITASGCTVNFGDWNDYYYCELVSNGKAAYTHDHKMSRLEQVASVDVKNKTVVTLKGKTVAIPTSGKANYVVVKSMTDGAWDHGDGSTYATCYHFVDGVVWNHSDAGTEIVNEVEVLKEDKTIVYREFNNLVTGYGWGVTTMAINYMPGVNDLDVDEGEQQESVVKFNGKVSQLVDYQTYKLGDIFEFVNNGVDLVPNAISVSVNNQDSSNPVSAIIEYAGEDWTNGTITLKGVGAITITIQDYYFCTPTTIAVTVTEHAHKYDSVTTNPDCLNGGHTTYTCTVCNYTYIDEIAALGHTDGTPVTENEVANSCTEAGSYDTVVYCTVCDAELSRETTVVPSAGHTEVIDKAVAPTCTATGLTEGKHCSVCSAVIVAQETVAALGHTEVVDKAVAPTCTATGLTEGKHCSVCNAVIVAQETVDALGHTEVVDKAVAPTCTETGLTEGKHCSVCNAVIVAQETVDKLGHTPGAEADCDNAQKCTVCGETLVAARGHNMQDATCDSASKCSECSHTEGEALGHIEKIFTGDFLYRVGNKNAVQLSSLFNVGKHNVTVSGEKVAGNASVTVNGTSLEFKGTGVVKITLTVGSACVECQAKRELMLEVVDATNVTSATNATSQNIVLLNDCGFGSLEVSGGYTIYGNGFTMTCGSDSVAADLGYSFVTLENGTLDNVQIVLPNFDYAALYKSNLTDSSNRSNTDSSGKTRYYNARSGVMVSGNSQILNSRISGARAAVNVTGGNCIIENSRLELGAVASLLVGAANSLTLRDVTLVQKPTASTYDPSKTLMGFSVLYMCDSAGKATPTTLEGSFVQYAWVNESDKKYVPSKAQDVVAGVIKQTDYKHNIDGTDYWNLGFAYMPEDTSGSVNKPNNITDNRSNKATVPYETATVNVKIALASIDVYVYSYKNSNGTAESFINTGDYVPNKQGDIITVDYGDINENRVLGKVYGEDGWVYQLAVDLDQGAYTFDFSKLTVQKNNVSLGISRSDKVDVVEGTTVYELTLEDGSTIKFKLIGTATTKEAPKWSNDANGTNLSTSMNASWEAGLCVASKKGGTWSGAAPALQNVYIRYYSTEAKAYKVIHLADYTPNVTGKVNGTNTTCTINGPDFTLTLTGGQVHSSNKVNAMPVVCNGKLYFVAANSNGLVNSGNSARSVPVSYSFTDGFGNTITGSHSWSVAEDKNNEYNYSEFCNGKLTAASSGGCFAEGTMVTLADGTQKPIEDITFEDQILAWDFNTGKYVATVASLIDRYEASEQNVINLRFSDGAVVRMVVDHGFFDVDANKFVFLNEENVASYVGHTFVKACGDGTYENVELVGYEITVETVAYYAIQTAIYNNCIVEGMFTLTTPPEMIKYSDWFNYFEIGDDMKYDEEKMQADIEKYGLYTYEDFADYVTYEQFIAFNGPYLKVLVGRGVVTYEQIIELIAIYVNVES